MMLLFQLPKQVYVANSRTSGGAKLYFYLTGTTTEAAVYSDSGLTTAHSQPITSASSGVFAPIYLDPSVSYKVQLKTSSGSLIYEVDPVGSLTATELGAGLYPISTAETSAGLASTDLTLNYEYGDVRRYGAVGDGVTDDTAAIQYALNSNKRVTFPQGVFVTGALTLPDWVTMEGQGYTPGIGATGRVTELKFTLTGTGAAITCGSNPVIRNILFQNYGGSYDDGTAALSGTTSPCILLTGNAVITECSFYAWYKCIVTGASTYYLKTSRVHFNRCTYGYYGETTAPYNIDIDQPHATYIDRFVSSSGTNYPRNVKVMGGSIELYNKVAEKFIDISFFGTYFETGSPRASVIAIEPGVNACSVSLYGCLIYMDVTSRFVNMSSLTNAMLTASGNVFDGAGPASSYCYYLPASGAVSLSGDRFGTGHDNSTLYVDSVNNAAKFNGITMPLLPAANDQAAYSGVTIAGQKGFVSVGLAAAPTSPATGLSVMADGVSWDPLSRSAGRPYWVLWQGDRWRSLDGE